MKVPLRVADIPYKAWYEGTNRYVKGKAICDIGGVAKVGVGLMELPSGSNTLPAHWHSDEEEHIYVLSGSTELTLNSQTFQLTSGDYVCFEAGKPVFHYLENTSDESFVYLMIGERIANDKVTHLKT